MSETDVAHTHAHPGTLKVMMQLMKLRVIVLLQITALCAILVHDTFARLGVMDIDRTWGQTLQVSLITVIGGTLSAGGSNAINMWYDADIDPHMRRTMNRPIPLGHATPRFALTFGAIIAVVGSSLFLLVSLKAAFWSAFSVMFYVLVYSIWLKRRTPQNIVIGGIAGSTPPLIGWAAAAGDSIANANMLDLGSPVPWMLFFLIFLWTPPHFWALALYRSGVRQSQHPHAQRSQRRRAHRVPIQGVLRAVVDVGIRSLFLARIRSPVALGLCLRRTHGLVCRLGMGH